MVVIDTTIWSKAYRRKKIATEDWPIVNELHILLDIAEEVLIGSVRQELLSGISTEGAFGDLTEKLNGFNNYEAQLADHDLAAEYFNLCVRKGIQGSQTDFLICAIANRHDWEILTEDKDFIYYKKFLPIKLYEVNR